MTEIAAFALLIALLACGIEVYLALGSVVALLHVLDGRSLAGMAQVVLDHMNSPTLMSVPFFVIAATFVERGGVARALLEGAMALIGVRRAGLALVTVLAAAVFSAISGSSVATAMALGTILIPAMQARGYGRPFALGLVGTAGTLGILIPPSLSFVLYGVMAEISVPRLFLAGVIPGLLQAAILAVYARWACRDLDEIAPSDVLAPNTRQRAIVHAIPALSLPVLVLGGIYAGFVTVTEAAALSAALAILLSLRFYKGCSLSEAPALLAHALQSTASILIIVASAIAFGHWITESGLSARLLGWISASGMAGWQFLLLMNALLLLMGMFFEALSVLLIVVPPVLPLLPALGIDPIHFAVVLTVNLEIGLLTPPVGMNLFVLSSISGAPTEEVIRGVMPFVLLMAVFLFVVTFVPTLSTALPTAVFGH